VGLLVITWPANVRWLTAAVVTLSLGVVAMTIGSGKFFRDPIPRARAAVSEARTMIEGSRRQRTLAASKTTARGRLAVDPRLLRLLRGHSVSVEPFESSAVWAYGLRWQPELLIQSYMATDHALDLMNAQALVKRGPDRILRRLEDSAEVDGKNPLLLSPESDLVVVCRYRQLGARGTWDVFGRATDRCGRSRLLQSVDARDGESVTVPRPPKPNDLVYARIHVHETLEQRIASVVAKPVHLPRLALDSTSYRLAPDAARGPMIVYMPATAGVSAGFGGKLNYRRLALGNIGSGHIDFYAMPLEKR
jgi:hypothetical protein